MKIDGNRIKKIRLNLGKTQEEFGQLFEPPASKSAVSRWEAGGSPSKNRLKKIAQLAGIPVEGLVKDSLTEKQKNCPYCHGLITQGQMLDKTPSGDGWLGMANSGFFEYHINGITVLGGKFNFCPMCGRPLNEEEE